MGNANGARRPKLLLTRAWPGEVVRRLQERYAVALNERDEPLDQSSLAQAMRDFDALCPTVTDRIDANVIDAPGATVRILANFGAGLDHIDRQAAARAGLVVTNTPDVLTDATAELAVLLMLMASRRASEGEHELRSGRWSGWRPTHLIGASIRGKTLGLIGFGRIAQATAAIASQAFGMKIIYHSRRPAALPEHLRDADYMPRLADLLKVADVVSLHCPGGAETRHLLNRQAIQLLKPTAIIINTARGTVIDEAALAEALHDRRIAGAGLDVYEREPVVSEALLAAPNVTLLPHLGSATAETRIAMGMRVADNLDAFFNGIEPPDRVAP